MALPLALIGGGAALGAIGGLFKKGPSLQLSAEGRAAQQAQLGAMNQFQQLANVGPGQQDVAAALEASRGYANTLNNVASSGLYDMQRGNQLAEQIFGAQRVQMQQGFQDQLMQANRAATAAGRSSNDPILRARLAQDQMRQQALLAAQQSAAAVDLGRQSTLDMLSLQGQRVNALQGLSQQAFGNQQALYGMGQQLYNTEMQRMFGTAQYEQSRGGGVMGALTGALGGASAGLNIATGLGKLIGPATGGLQVTDVGFGGSLDSPVAARSAPQGFSFTDEGFGGTLDAPQGVSYGQVFGPPAPTSNSYAPISSMTARLGTQTTTPQQNSNTFSNLLSGLFGWMAPGSALKR